MVIPTVLRLRRMSRNHTEIVNFIPFPLMKSSIIGDILESSGMEKSSVRGKNIETSVFEDSIIVVNHNSSPIKITVEGEKIFQYDIDGHTLIPRSAVYIKSPCLSQRHDK